MFANTSLSAVNNRIVVELVQVDPPGSPTPGAAHLAGYIDKTFRTPRAARRAANKRLGKPFFSKDRFEPCCAWQQRKTTVEAFALVLNNEERVPLYHVDIP